MEFYGVDGAIVTNADLRQYFTSAGVKYAIFGKNGEVYWVTVDTPHKYYVINEDGDRVRYFPGVMVTDNKKNGMVLIFFVLLLYILNK